MVIIMKNVDTIQDVDFEIKWEGQPAGFWRRFLSLLHLNFTTYQITKDELIIKNGFFHQNINTTELYLLKDPDMSISLWQRFLKIGTIHVVIDSHSKVERAGEIIVLKDVKDCEKVRKLLRDSIEADVMERNITYLDKV